MVFEHERIHLETSSVLIREVRRQQLTTNSSSSNSSSSSWRAAAAAVRVGLASERCTRSC
jgi:hypothetical protein